MLILRLPGKIIIVLLLFFAAWFSGCKPARELSTVNLKPVGTARLLKNNEANSLNYENFSISRISCQYSSGQSSASFRINLKAIRDKKILASITKLNIPVGRILLTPDSVVYVNFMDKNYFVDDYSYLANYLNIDLDFATIQSIISNNAFSYRNDEKDRDFKTFTSFIEGGMYVLQSEKERKVLKLESKGKPEKIDRRLKRLDDTALILQKMYFNPESFALTKLFIEDKTNNRQMNMDFSDFTKVDEKDYPGEINLNLNSGSDVIEIRVKVSGFSTAPLEDFNLEIPEKYEQIKTK